MSTSERIADFLDFLRGCPEAYRMRRADQQEEENRTQDLLHKLELEPLGYHDTARAARVLADARRRRRTAKDEAEELEPVVEYLQANQAAVKALERLLGAVRKAEKRHEDRFYIPRAGKEG